MATKAKSKAAKSPLAQVQESINGLQREGEKLVGRARKEIKRVSNEQTKAVRELIDQATKIRTDLQKRAEKTVKDIETRADKILKRIESQADKGITGVVRRLNLPTRKDIDGLSKRIRAVEKRLETLGRKKAA